MQHLHWVSACRVDIPQPAGGHLAGEHRPGPNVGIKCRKRKRRPDKFVIGGAQVRNLLNSRMPENPSAQIAGIYRYPVKGLTPEQLPRVALSAGQTLPADRRFAIENGP